MAIDQKLAAEYYARLSEERHVDPVAGKYGKFLTPEDWVTILSVLTATKTHFVELLRERTFPKGGSHQELRTVIADLDRIIAELEKQWAPS